MVSETGTDLFFQLEAKFGGVVYKPDQCFPLTVIILNSGCFSLLVRSLWFSKCVMINPCKSSRVSILIYQFNQREFGVVKKFIVIVVGVLLASDLFAECNQNACYGVAEDALVSVYPNSSGNIYLQAGVGKENLDCALVEDHFMVLKSDHPLFKEAYSTLLAALMSQKQLTVRIKNGSPICEVSYVRMYM